MFEIDTTDTNPNALCRRMRATRRRLEMSQLEVALHIGISQSQYSLFENGNVQLSADQIERLRIYLREAINSTNRLVS